MTIMMKRLKYVLLTVFLCLQLCLPVSAQEAGGQASSGPADYVFWTEENIVGEVSGEDGAAKIVLKAGGLAQDYGYMAVISNDELFPGEGQEASGIKIPFSVRTSAPFYLSVELRDKKGHTARLRDSGMFAVREQEETVLLRFEEKQYEVSKTAEGTLILPYDAFEGSREFRWDEPEGFLIGIMMQSDSSMTLTLRTPEPLTAEEYTFRGLENAEITGPGEMELPVQGESLERFQASDDSFVLMQPEKTKGVVLEKGYLKVNRDAVPGGVLIEARRKDGIVIRKKVLLKEPLRSRAEYLPDFPAPERVTPVAVPAAAFWDDWVFTAVRAAGTAIAAIVLAAYFVFYRRALRELEEGN